MITRFLNRFTSDDCHFCLLPIIKTARDALISEDGVASPMWLLHFCFEMIPLTQAIHMNLPLWLSLLAEPVQV